MERSGRSWGGETEYIILKICLQLKIGKSEDAQCPVLSNPQAFVVHVKVNTATSSIGKFAFVFNTW